MVHLGPDGRSAPVPAFKPEEEWQIQLLREAEARRRIRMERLRFVRERLEKIRPPT